MTSARARIDRVAPVHESSSKSEDLVKADHYDSFAESYSAENESSLLNGYYERRPHSVPQLHVLRPRSKLSPRSNYSHPHLQARF